MVNNMLSSEKPKEGVCHHCGHKAAVVMCRDCLPRSLYCTACDLSTHEALVLHGGGVLQTPAAIHFCSAARGREILLS